jgi:hypothetical protein
VSATVLSSATLGISIYLRAHKREPLAPVYLLTSLVVLALALMLGKRFGAIGITTGYLGALALIQLPLSIIVFRRRRMEWHRLPSASPIGVIEPADEPIAVV